MTVRADCTNCSMLVELVDTKENRANVENVARLHAIRTGHPVRVFVLEELALHACAGRTSRESRELEDPDDDRCSRPAAVGRSGVS